VKYALPILQAWFLLSMSCLHRMSVQSMSVQSMSCLHRQAMMMSVHVKV
jgi:hypothetical protein